MGMFIDISEDGVIIVGFGDVVDEFLNEYSFVDIGIIEEINFFIMGVRGEEVDDFDIGNENFGGGGLFNEFGSFGVNGEVFVSFDGFMFVDWVIGDVYDMIKSGRVDISKC